MTTEPTDYREAVRAAMERYGLTVNAWARKAAVPPASLYAWLRGEQASVGLHYLERLAAAADMTLSQLLAFGEPRVPIPVRYVVGLFGRLEDATQFYGRPFSVMVAPLLDGDAAYAIKAEGRAMHPFSDEWTAIARAVPIGPALLIGRLCVVQVATSGSLYIRFIHRGSAPDRFRLSFWNSPDMEDVEVAWCHVIERMEQVGSMQSDG
jgi:transcriptional regulator with XRE-family HTH domain